MAQETILKNSEHESSLIAKRVYISGLIILLLVLMIISRVFYLTVLEYDHFTTLSKSNRVKITPIPPIRGLIYSRDGILLAENKPIFSLEVIPEQIDDVDELINQLKKIISIEDNDIKRFKKSLKKKRRFENVALRLNLNEEEAALFAVNRHRFSGVDVVAGLNRYYPLGEELVHSIGYVARIDEDDMKKLNASNYSGTTHIGKLGIEKSYESLLHGDVGYQQVEVNAQGRVIRVLDRTAPKPGENLHLTIDISLQRVAIEALKNKRGAIVAIDPRNGDILTFVSSPGYDPNKFVNGIDTKSYKALLSSKDKPLINRATQGKYPPGSTIKPFMGLLALNNGVRNLNDESWCPGWFSLKGHEHRYRDWKKQGHGHTDLHKAIIQSCDVFFYILAHELGINRIHQGLSKFGLGKKSGIDISGESKALLPSREWKRKALGQAWFPGETLIIGIGQGYALTTPIQLAKATASLASRGNVVVPRLVFSTSSSITNEKKELPIKTEDKIIMNNERYWGDIIQSMRDVVHGVSGTAWRSGLNAKYEFAGKTGTAQVIGIAQDKEYNKDEISEEFQDHALFIAFAPVESPEIAVAIIVENGGGGSKTAAPIARKMFDNFMNKILVNKG
ncbi:MAG TPA: penicillin-binding protein 2 [Thiotrichaceae bacterium]|jgi:penicillin-binding protein 2|nr:penicillin-binding protein 2 [Thiotrichaceae bacterium]HIM07929.1 penicillin-binding protein 2 [Gammaproteobacteria bacterium]